MKTLKFKSNLVPLILNGSKTVSWRLFDDKNLSNGDNLSFINSETLKEFTKAKVVSVVEKTFDEIWKYGYSGHEIYSSKNEMIAKFTDYYKIPLDGKTKVKIIKFKLQ